MKTLKEKLSQVVFYDVLAIVIAIALPIALKNGWACVPGVTIAMFLSYQAVVYYKTIKSNNYIVINATCVKKARGNVGAMTYSEKCYFQPDKSENVHGIIELQIATENSALVNSNKFRKKKKRQGNEVLTGDICELVFEKPKNYSDGGPSVFVDNKVENVSTNLINTKVKISACFNTDFYNFFIDKDYTNYWEIRYALNNFVLPPEFDGSTAIAYPVINRNSLNQESTSTYDATQFSSANRS